MSIREIAYQINTRANKYSFGELQDLRKEIKGLSKKASSKIFTNESISDEDWAFHYGGRKELQFNIAFEGEELRYGVAFSLEVSRSLPDVSILYPKVLKLNSLIRNETDRFTDYQMWYWKEGKRSKTKGVYEIPDNLAQEGTFIFIGKLISKENIDYDEILKTFDDLLYVYQEVETESGVQITQAPTTKTKFEFSNKHKLLPKTSSYSTIEREINVDIRHSFLQEKLYHELVAVYGEDAVGLENHIFSNRIDIVVKLYEGNYVFYEVKTGNSAKSCIRQAMGQLLEYAHWGNSGFNAEMIIAGEFKIDKTTSDYLQHLKSHYKIPISYYCIGQKSITKENLQPKEDHQ